MKTLIIVRHAKSSWDNLLLDDYDRTLNDRGRGDANVMADLIGDKVPLPCAIVSSGAKRAMETVCIFKSKNSRLPDVQVNENLYLAEENTLRSVVSETPDSVDNLLICGHNPGLSGLIRELTNEKIEDISTCCITVIDLPISCWVDIYGIKGVITHCFVPKMFKDGKRE